MSASSSPDLRSAPGGQARQATERTVRTLLERRAHVTRRLAAEDKLWLATATDGTPHLVPFSYVWQDDRLWLATPGAHRTARNARASGWARAALDGIADVVIMDGPIAVVPIDALDESTAERLSRRSAFDARQAPGFVYLQLTLRRVQTWHSWAELASPTIMRDGVWLDDHDHRSAQPGDEGRDGGDDHAGDPH